MSGGVPVAAEVSGREIPLPTPYPLPSPKISVGETPLGPGAAVDFGDRRVFVAKTSAKEWTWMVVRRDGDAWRHQVNWTESAPPWRRAKDYYKARVGRLDAALGSPGAGLAVHQLLVKSEGQLKALRPPPRTEEAVGIELPGLPQGSMCRVDPEGRTVAVLEHDGQAQTTFAYGPDEATAVEFRGPAWHPGMAELRKAARGKRHYSVSVYNAGLPEEFATIEMTFERASPPRPGEVRERLDRVRARLPPLGLRVEVVGEYCLHFSRERNGYRLSEAQRLKEPRGPEWLPHIAFAGFPAPWPEELDEISFGMVVRPGDVAVAFRRWMADPRLASLPEGPRGRAAAEVVCAELDGEAVVVEHLAQKFSPANRPRPANGGGRILPPPDHGAGESARPPVEAG